MFRLGLFSRCILKELSSDPSQGFADGPRWPRADETARGVVLLTFSNELMRESSSADTLGAGSHGEVVQQIRLLAAD